MISQQRINELKRYNDSHKFFDAVLCEMSIVRQHREVFEAKAREFGNKCLEYTTACNKRIDWGAVKEAIKAARKRKDINVRCTTPNNPPKDKWKRIDTQIERDDLSFPWHFWVPPDFPDNPANWFNIYDPFHYHEMGRFAEEMYGLNKVSCSPEEMLLRDYVALVCLFNKGAEDRGEMPILPEVLSDIEIQKDYEINIYAHLWPKVKAVFIRTLEAVNDDLASTKAAETEQKELPLLLPSCRDIKHYVYQIETPRELLDFLRQDKHKRIYDSCNFGNEPSFFEIIREGAIRIREKHLSLNLPPVPSADDIVAYKNWCIDAHKILDESIRSKTNLASTKQINGKTISQIIEQGEGHTIEFKETLEYDVKTNKNNKDVLLSSLKTIAGFLNANGGTLLMGVNDSGETKGIERDLSTMKHGNNDRFEQKIRNCLKDRFSPQPLGKVDMSFEKFTEGMICRVDVQANKEIVHLDGDIYVREGNTTRKLEGRDRTDWIQQREK